MYKELIDKVTHWQSQAKKLPEIPPYFNFHQPNSNYIIFSIIFSRNFAAAINMVKEGPSGLQSPSQKRKVSE